jgi:hypothetical protein
MPCVWRVFPLALVPTGMREPLLQVRFVNPVGRIRFVSTPCSGDGCTKNHLNFPASNKLLPFRVVVEPNCILLSKPECPEDETLRRAGLPTQAQDLLQKGRAGLPPEAQELLQRMLPEKQDFLQQAVRLASEANARRQGLDDIGTHCPCSNLVQNRSLKMLITGVSEPSPIETKAFTWLETAIGTEFLNSDAAQGLVSGAKSRINKVNPKLTRVESGTSDRMVGCMAFSASMSKRLACEYEFDNSQRAWFIKPGKFAVSLEVDGVESNETVEFIVGKYSGAMREWKIMVRPAQASSGLLCFGHARTLPSPPSPMYALCCRKNPQSSAFFAASSCSATRRGRASGR